MSLADYYSRWAMAAAQVLADFDHSEFVRRLEGASLGIRFDQEAGDAPEGRALLDLLVRLAARLYPKLTLQAPDRVSSLAAELAQLASRINPVIGITEGGDASFWIGVGSDAVLPEGPGVYAGSCGWTGLVSAKSAQPTGPSRNPFGAGAAACLASANAFRFVFAGPSLNPLDRETALSTWRLSSGAGPDLEAIEIPDLTLVGVGAIGNATVWALAQLPTTGVVHLIDPEAIELSNLQRYVLALRDDDGQSKLAVAERYLTGSMRAGLWPMSWADFVEKSGEAPQTVLVALDSATDRRAVQASLPRWIANAWTQTGDLGVSTHHFLGDGACLRCLYLPKGEIPSDDAILAGALGIPDQLMRVRDLLYHRAAAPRDLLDLIASRFGVDPATLSPYEGMPLARLYKEALCGGALLPLGAGDLAPQLHVPLNHQSALAGILLAASGTAHALGFDQEGSRVTRINVMSPLPEAVMTLPIQKDPRGLCICQDRDYQGAYRLKYRSQPRKGTTPRASDDGGQRPPTPGSPRSAASPLST
jgi:hypothetical protein